MEDDELYRGLRPFLFAIAYRMVSSASEAEDIVQESYVRLEQVRRGPSRASIDVKRNEPPSAGGRQLTTP